MTDEPTQRLEEGRRLLDAGDPGGALRVLGQLTGHPDPALAGQAWLLIGDARYRTDDEPGALAAWQAAARAGGATAWIGWRNVARQLVRDGRLDDALAAYREADRGAPPEERPEIASRIAWLLKESGHDFAARREFNRSRGAYAAHVPYVTYAIIAACAATFLADAALTSGASLSGGLGPLGEQNLIAWAPVAAGEWWRIITSAFFHLGLLHIGMNMYVLYLYGPVVERMYGSVEFAAIYLLSAAGGSVLTILVDRQQAAVGASGAIFGLIGLLFVVGRRHHALLGPQARRVLAGMGGYIAFLLLFTFLVPGISWTGHVGGLAVGVVLGFILPPTGVATLAGMWRAPGGEPLQHTMPVALRGVVYGVVIGLLVVGTIVAIDGQILGELLG